MIQMMCLHFGWLVTMKIQSKESFCVVGVRFRKKRCIDIVRFLLANNFRRPQNLLAHLCAIIFFSLFVFIFYISCIKLINRVHQTSFFICTSEFSFFLIRSLSSHYSLFPSSSCRHFDWRFSVSLFLSFSNCIITQRVLCVCVCVSLFIYYFNIVMI